MYKDKFKRLVIMGAVAYAVAFLIIAGELGVTAAIFMSLGCAGIPYGWVLSGKAIGGLIVIGSFPVMIIAFMIRVFIALLTGWIAYPIALIYTFIKMKWEGRIY